ncbi:MAG: histidinol dehydrogenase [Candidatus Azotimanducaceae bacterium]|jgi:histidinol dehydrogenase
MHFGAIQTRINQVEQQVIGKSMSMIKQISTLDASFDDDLTALLAIQQDNHQEVYGTVRDIVDDVRCRGDAALVELTSRFDRFDVTAAADLEISQERMAAALASIDDLVRGALEASIERVRRYHQEQRRAFGDQRDWEYQDVQGNRLGQRVRPMQRVGIYVPGGKAAYPSSVIMTAIPARVAEVGEIILVVPTPDGEINDVLLAAACLCGVDRLFTVGGAQAVAALAYGTQTIPKVDKIVGPGNIYVATAKEIVFGDVGIDMIAGPSEVLIVADAGIDPEWLVMDMFAQAEHDELAQSVLISSDAEVLSRVAALIEARLPGMARESIIRQSISDRGALILTRDDTESAAIVNRIAPEHLELALVNADEFVELVEHAGAIFVGNHSAEVVGDYSAGPSHVLPTSGTARFASALGVYDFQVRSSIIRCSAAGSVSLSRDAAILATEEGLEAHARSASCRVQG